MIVPYNRNHPSRTALAAMAGATAASGYMINNPYRTARAVYNTARYAYNAGRSLVPSFKSAPVPVAVAPMTVRRVKKRVAPKKKPTLKKQVKQLQHDMNNLTSTLTYRSVDTLSMIVPANEAKYTARLLNTNSTVESALAQLRFFDSATPNTLVQASGASGTYGRKYKVRQSMVFTIRNNYQTPIEMRLYKYHCKADTTLTPLQSMQAGLTDIGAPSDVSTVVYPSDVDQIKDCWTPKGCKIYRLLPGQMKTYTLYGKFYDYSPNQVDSQTEEYQRNHNVECVLIRIQGVPAHDKTTITQLGSISGGIDWSEKRTITVKYNSGGAAIEYLYISDSNDAMTAGPVISQPVVDNQEYSAS